MKISKNNNIKTEEDNLFNISKFKGRIDDLHNKAIFNQDYAIDLLRDFFGIEKSVKTNNKDVKNTIIAIKKFFNDSSKNNFYLANLLKDFYSLIERLTIDEVSGLKTKQSFYEYVEKVFLNNKNNKKENNSKIKEAEVFKFRGNKFAAVIVRSSGFEIAFMNLTYLNYINEIAGRANGDFAIFSAANIIEKTLKSYLGETIKTKDIIEKILNNFNNFKFDKKNEILNNNIFNVDIGFSNDLEIEKIEEEIKKQTKSKIIKEKIELSNSEKINILIELAIIRASFQEKISKFYFLISLYRESLKNEDLKNVFSQYISFTKNGYQMIPWIMDMQKNIKTEEDLILKITKKAENIGKENFSKTLNSGLIIKNKAINDIIFSQAIKNFSKTKPKNIKK